MNTTPQMHMITFQSSLDQAPLSAVVEDTKQVLPLLRRMADHGGATERTPEEWAEDGIDPSDDWAVVKFWCGIPEETTLDLDGQIFDPNSNGESTLVVTRLSGFGEIIDGWSGHGI